MSRVRPLPNLQKMKQGVRLGQQLVTAVFHEEPDLSDQVLDEIRADCDLTNGALLGLSYVTIGGIRLFADKHGADPADLLANGFAEIDHLFEDDYR